MRRKIPGWSGNVSTAWVAAALLWALALGCATTGPADTPSSGDSEDPAPGYVRDLPPLEFRNYVEGRADITLIDLRTDSEVALDYGPFPQALRIPSEQLEARLDELPADRDRPVAIYDRTGLRSVTAARLIAGSGVREVVTLLGGLDAYRRAGL